MAGLLTATSNRQSQLERVGKPWSRATRNCRRYFTKPRLASPEKPTREKKQCASDREALLSSMTLEQSAARQSSSAARSKSWPTPLPREAAATTTFSSTAKGCAPYIGSEQKLRSVVP